MPPSATEIKALAHACGFELAGVTAALPSEDFSRFEEWRSGGLAADMSYMTDRRGDLRSDPRHLLPSARSMLCVAKLYNMGDGDAASDDSSQGVISRYAWGADYHEVLRENLESLVGRIAVLCSEPFEWRICVDTAPLLERSYAQAAGLGWIGKNTCLINQQQGSWFFLGELLLSFPLEADRSAAHRCGTCTRCIDACPTDAIVQHPDTGWMLDSARCISYLTIEKRGALPDEFAGKIGNRIFGCDICQDVCPWNRRAPILQDGPFGMDDKSAPLDRYAELSEDQFRLLFRRSPVWRTKYQGFIRNVAVAMGNSGQPCMAEPLQRLAAHFDPVIAATAAAALHKLNLGAAVS